MRFNIIVCYCDKNGIGINNTIPWRLSDDLKHFKNITTNNIDNQKNIVIMGRNTYDSIPKKYKPLNNRYNFVVSKTKYFEDKDKADYVGETFEKCIEHIKTYNKYNLSKIFIIGGEMLYNYVMSNYTDSIISIYVTELYMSYECDKFFPKITNNRFTLNNISDFRKENNMYYRYLLYINNNKQNVCNLNNYINNEELQYKNLIENILENGCERIDRTKVGTLSLFAPTSIHYNLKDTFPLCTLKKGFLRAIFEELMLYIRGQTNNNILKEKKIHIWDGNTTREFLDSRDLQKYPEGDMGETYGFNMRHYGGTYVDCNTIYDKNNGFDQLKYVIDLIKNDPHSRRILINLWNPKTLENAALPSCLHQYQFYVNTIEKTLSVQIYLRSSDVFLANNWNVCTGALFVHLLCNLETIDLTPGSITMICGDAHIYKNHIELAKKMIQRDSYPYGKLIINCEKKNIEDFVYEDIKLIGYKSHNNDLKGVMAV